MDNPVPSCDRCMTKAADYLQRSLHPKEGFAIIVFDDGNTDGQAFVSNRLTDVVMKHLRALVAMYEDGELPERTVKPNN